MNSDQLEQTDIFSLGLRTRAIKQLTKRGIRTLGDVSRLTRQELAMVPDIGPKAIELLQAHLATGPSPAADANWPRFITLDLPPRLLEMLDVWRRAERANNPPSRAEAIQLLLRDALENWLNGVPPDPRQSRLRISTPD